MISRVSNRGCAEAQSTKWFPEVDSDMTHCYLNSTMTQYYVLHAKHQQSNVMTFGHLLGEKFEEICQAAGLEC